MGMAGLLTGLLSLEHPEGVAAAGLAGVTNVQVPRRRAISCRMSVSSPALASGRTAPPIRPTATATGAIRLMSDLR